jgi:hypothetical protein
LKNGIAIIQTADKQCSTEGGDQDLKEPCTILAHAMGNAYRNV